MFIRFYCGEIDECSGLAGGLFCAVTQLQEHCYVPKYELEAVDEVVSWFNKHMASPFDYLPELPRYEHAVCWFKSSAHECLAKARELVTILERNDILIWTIKSHRVGRLFYEDESQVFALPHPELRRIL
jgi:hypothetical protein